MAITAPVRIRIVRQAKVRIRAIPRLVPKDGDPGTAATIEIGSVTTLPAGSPATVVNAGTENAAEFQFGIPEGGKGDPGNAATVAVGTVSAVASSEPPTVTNSGTENAAVLDFEIPAGGQGDPGDAATITVGTVTTVNPGDPATVTNVGTSAAAVFNFEIPKGEDGTGNGTVTSIAISVPTGLEVSGSPITTSGTFAITFASGYSIPTNTKQGQWDTAYGWGNHASAGYLTTSAAAAAYQPLDSDLTTLAGLTATTNNFIVSVSSAWASRTPAQVRTTLGLVVGTDVQAYSAALDSWAGVTRASGFDTFAATPSSANLAALVTNETGSGALVFGTSPTLVTPALGTPSTLTLTNATGLPAAGTVGTAATLSDENQALTGGATVTSKSLGTTSSGTRTLDLGDCPLQHYTNNGAHTLAPGSVNSSALIDITNGASAGAITTSGWTKVAGDAFTTTNGHKFRCHCSVGNGGSLLIVQALQ